MNAVRVKVSLKLLADALHFPDTSQIRMVWHEEDYDRAIGTVTLLVEDACLPPVPEGGRPPVASPSWKVEYVDNQHPRINEVTLVDWGLNAE